MEKIEIDNKMFGIHICPRYGKVYAEIYYTGITDNIERQVLNCEFGSNWRKPVENDYIQAKQWAWKQLEYITNANKSVSEILCKKTENHLTDKQLADTIRRFPVKGKHGSNQVYEVPVDFINDILIRHDN